jgi:hypothetical protein
MFSGYSGAGVRRRGSTLLKPKRTVIGVGGCDPFRSITVRYIRTGFSCQKPTQQNVFPLVIIDTPGEMPRTTALPFPTDAPQREDFTIASTLFLIDAKDKLNTGLVHAETI